VQGGGATQRSDGGVRVTVAGVPFPQASAASGFNGQQTKKWEGGVTSAVVLGAQEQHSTDEVFKWGE